MKRTMLVGSLMLALAAVTASSEAGALPQAASLVGRPQQPRQNHALRVETKLPQAITLVSQARPYSQSHYVRGGR